MREKGLEPVIPSSFLGLECATLPTDGEERISLVGKRKDVYLSMGAGPWCTGPSYPFRVEETVKKLECEIEKLGADAIGECGFDFHWNYGPIEEQEALFLSQSEMAKELDISLIIHSREADEILLKHIDRIDDKTIMHCFSSSKDVMMKLLERGAYISFAGNVTYKNSSLLQEAAKLCPIERLLYETDSPYLTPVPKRGTPNRMENTEFTLAFLSALRGEESEYIRENVMKNFLLLMKNRESTVRRDTVSREN